MEVRDGKLIQLLSRIEESELKLLMKFAKSPYHNSNKQIIPLLEKLLTYHPTFEYKKLTKEFLYRQIHPKSKPYHEGRMNLLMTNLVSVVQKFYKYQEFEQDELLQKRLQGKAYNKRGFYKKYKKEVEGMLTHLNASPYREEDYFFQKYDVQQEFFFHIETPTGPSGAVLLYDAIDDLDDFYLTAKLSLAAEQITMTKKLNTKTEIRFLDPILEHLKENKNEHSIVVQIYYKFLKLRINGHDQKEYDELKEMFLENLEKMELLKRKLVYYNLINYWVANYNKARKESLRELFDLYKFGLEKNYIINNNTITDISYSNIASIASNMKEFEWGYDFIIKYEKYLPRKDAYHTKLMALAFWNQQKGVHENYNFFYNTLDLLKEVTYSKRHIMLYLRSRNLWIRTCYELLKFDPHYFITLSNYINNFEIQLKKDKTLSREITERYFPFIMYMKRLIKLYMKDKIIAEDIGKLRRDLNAEKVVATKMWILDKIKELQVN